jgi:hypothetical protein
MQPLRFLASHSRSIAFVVAPLALACVFMARTSHGNPTTAGGSVFVPTSFNVPLNVTAVGELNDPQSIDAREKPKPVLTLSATLADGAPFTGLGAGDVSVVLSTSETNAVDAPQMIEIRPIAGAPGMYRIIPNEVDNTTRSSWRELTYTIHVRQFQASTKSLFLGQAAVHVAKPPHYVFCDGVRGR